jgi:hypothetical protein
MRWAITTTLLLGLAALALGSDGEVAPEPRAWEEIEPTKLWQSVARGEATASGRNPRGYSQVELTVVNKAKKRIVVDTGGSHLRPRRRGSCQRLGLGPPVVASAAETGDKGEVLLRIEPGEAKTLLLNTCCLDAGRPSPRTHQFDAVAQPLPKVREKVLRWWVDNPETPQGNVNSAIWRNARTVVSGGATSTSSRRAGDLRIAAAHGGVYYQLKNNELTSIDAEGVRRVLGSQIELIFPTEGALYAVMPGEDGLPDLWRLAPTGENPWGFVTDLDPSAELLDVVAAGSGDLVLLSSEHVALFSRETREQKRLLDIESDQFLSGRVTRSGKVDVTVHDPRNKGVQRGGAIEGQSAGRFEIWRIDPTKGTHEMRERSWNVSAFRAGDAGIYGLSHKGVLRRYARGKWKDVGASDEYASLVAIGRDVVWVLDERERLVAVSPESGRPRFRAEAKVSKSMWFDLDPVTGDLVYATSKGFMRISGVDGSVTKIQELADEVAEDAAERESDGDE